MFHSGLRTGTRCKKGNSFYQEKAFFMYSLKNKIVFITGASSGIGAACAHQFAQHGANLLLAARRIEQLENYAQKLRSSFHVKIHAMKLDVRKISEVETALNGLPQEWKNISVLVNNAGLARGMEPLHEGRIDDWEEMIDTNVKGLLYISRTVIPGMIERSGGHIINIGSAAGHWVYPKGNVYCATKFAVAALTEGLRMDLLGTPLRVSTIDPGLVETEFSVVRFHGDTQRAKTPYTGMTPLNADDIADAVLYSATRPPHVNIQEIILMPTAQAAISLVHRKQTETN
jgi:3-hydroxy acid dehydrogenase/malonic semialdehyde reductase